MGMPKADRSVQLSTAMYHPSSVTDGQPPVGVVGGSAAVSANELVPLLRKRLRFLLIVFAAIYLLYLFVWLSRNVSTPWLASIWSLCLATAVCLGLVGLVSSPVRLTLRQLRATEFLLFAVLVGNLVARARDLFWTPDFMARIHAMRDAGSDSDAREMLIGYLWRLTGQISLFLVAYGVIIPNTWRRCAAVVGGMTAIPVALWVAAGVSGRIPDPYLFNSGVVLTFMVLFQIAALAAYGAYRIETSRQEAV